MLFAEILAGIGTFHDLVLFSSVDLHCSRKSYYLNYPSQFKALSNDSKGSTKYREKMIVSASENPFDIKLSKIVCYISVLA